jgi:hypothetical protein
MIAPGWDDQQALDAALEEIRCELPLTVRILP